MLGYNDPLSRVDEKDTIQTGKYSGGSTMRYECFARGGNGALHKVDSIIRKELYVDWPKQHLITSAKKLRIVKDVISKWALKLIILLNWLKKSENNKLNDLE